MQAQQVELMRALTERMRVAVPRPAEGEQHAPTASAGLTEAQVAAQFANWKPATTEADLTSKREGFDIGGRRIVDAEGRILAMALDRATSNLTYVVDTGNRRFAIKAMNLAQAERITLATATREGSEWYVRTASGVRVSGDRITSTGLGFLVGRDNVLFRYVPGTGLSDIAAPEEFTLAAFQNGAVGTTGFVLLERTPKSMDDFRKDSGYGFAGLGHLIESGKRLGAMLGVGNGRADYALFNVDTGKVIPLEIGMDENQTQFMSQCYKKKSWLNICERSEGIDSVYSQDGSRNLSHYYWRVR